MTKARPQDGLARFLWFLPQAVGTRWLRWIVFLLLLAAWELFGRKVSEVLLAPPSLIVRAFVELLLSGELLHAIRVSLKSLLIGFLIGSSLGIVLGVLVGRFKAAAFVFEPFINGLYATPLVSLIPLVMLAFGLGLRGKVFFIVLVSIFPILINTIAGVRHVDARLLEVGRSFKASSWQSLREIVIPFALPYILTGVRLGIGRAVVGMVLAEMYLAFEGGLGQLLMAYGAALSTAKLFAVIIVIPLLGVALSKLTMLSELWLTPWNQNGPRRLKK